MSRKVKIIEEESKNPENEIELKDENLEIQVSNEEIKEGGEIDSYPILENLDKTMYKIIADSEYLKGKYQIGDIIKKDEMLQDIGLLAFHILRNRNLIEKYDNK